ncbi:CAB5 [[Candida] subhashii]|uniref:CAB5 n=1 Tax=[Candida] subhashii TaxID=561895 RepID=A0A8J5R7X6_9ASCO|nr:CAB5 [[Candida] subhashii]KAG7666385.1 CAB5 [[Candida] subhashii]
MRIVGLTGGIACGKSTVSRLLQQNHKLPIIDCDVVAREVILPNRRAYKRIIDNFRYTVPNLINPDQSINRPALGQAVFGNQQNLAILNSIVQPAIRFEIAKQLVKAYLQSQHMVILDAPLLYETKLHLLCRLVITVSCDEEIQVERLLSRNPELTKEDARKRISSQLSTKERNHRADIVLHNNKSPEVLQKYVEELVEEIRPNPIVTLLNGFPPFGLISALLTFSNTGIRDLLKATSFK